MLGHGEPEHAVITGIPGALLDHQVLGVDVEGVTGVDQDEEEQRNTPEPRHDEAGMSLRLSLTHGLTPLIT